MSTTITFKDLGTEVFYVNKKNTIKKGKIKSGELLESGIHYIINGDRIAKDCQANTIDNLKEKITTKLTSEHKAKIAEINATKEEDFEAVKQPTSE